MDSIVIQLLLNHVQNRRVFVDMDNCSDVFHGRDYINYEGYCAPAKV